MDEGFFIVGERVKLSYGEALPEGYPQDGMTGVVTEEFVGGRTVLFDEVYDKELSERGRKWDIGVCYLKTIDIEPDNEEIDINEIFENYLKENFA